VILTCIMIVCQSRT